jgi:hypothetical protein
MSTIMVTETQWVRAATEMAFKPCFVATYVATWRFDRAYEEFSQSVLMAEMLYDSWLGCFFLKPAVLARGSPR